MSLISSDHTRLPSPHSSVPAGLLAVCHGIHKGSQAQICGCVFVQIFTPLFKLPQFHVRTVHSCTVIWLFSSNLCLLRLSVLCTPLACSARPPTSLKHSPLPFFIAEASVILNTRCCRTADCRARWENWKWNGCICSVCVCV